MQHSENDRRCKLIWRVWHRRKPLVGRPVLQDFEDYAEMHRFLERLPIAAFCKLELIPGLERAPANP